MSTKPAEGERRAISGYRPQYLIGAALILRALSKGDLEWIRVADPNAGRVDDIQIVTSGRIDAHQVKWAQYPDAITLRGLTHVGEGEENLIYQLAQGWKELGHQYPRHRIVVHLTTNRIPSVSDSGMPPPSPKPTPYHFSAFIAQAWRPSQHRGIQIDDAWGAVWKELKAAKRASSEAQEEKRIDDNFCGAC